MKIKNLIKKIIWPVETFAPKTNKSFEASSSSYPLSNYNNYSYGGHSGGAKYPHGLTGDGKGHIIDHYRTRQNARSAYATITQAKALVDRFADTIVEIGLFLESVPKWEILGISAEAAEKWSSHVEDAFDSWARSKFSQRSQTNNFYQNQRLYSIMQQRDNDIFVRLFYSKDKKLINPLQIDFIDPDQIKGDTFTSTAGYMNCTIHDGIIRDNSGVEKAYQILLKKRKTINGYQHVSFEHKTIPAIGTKSKRRMMLHGFNPEFSGQGRGYSRLHHILQEFSDVTDFTLAQIKKAINQSNINMYVKPSQDNPASNPLEDIARVREAGPISQFGSDPVPADNAENVTTDSTNRVAFCPMPEAAITQPGSVGVFNLLEGEDLKPFDGKAPSESYDSFVDAFTSYLSASAGMPVEVLLMKFNQNYSASRAALILFWSVAKIWREEMAADFMNPIYESWLSEEIASGRISAPGWSDPRLKQAWLNNRWIGAPMPNIDPMRTARADKEYVEMGAQTLDRVSRNLNGSSGKSNRAKLTREFSELPEAPWKKGAKNV